MVGKSTQAKGKNSILVQICDQRDVTYALVSPAQLSNEWRMNQWMDGWIGDSFVVFCVCAYIAARPLVALL